MGNAVDTAKELLFSLVWVGSSAYHHENALRILEGFGAADWKAVLEEFVRLRDKKPGLGDPRLITGTEDWADARHLDRLAPLG
jgi:hypothetical protein